MINDEILTAYADGQLDVAAKAEVDRAAAEDPLVAKRLKAHLSLRTRKTQAFADRRGDAADRFGRKAAAGGSAAVIDLAAARAARAPPPKRKIPISGAMAASLALGLLVGAGLEALRPSALISGRSGAMVAGGALAQALRDQVATAQPRSQPIAVGSSYRTGADGYCRVFRIDQETTLYGVACRGPSDWSVKMALTAGGRSASGGAGGGVSSETPVAILRFLQDLRAGPPLTPQDELNARAKGWLAR